MIENNAGYGGHVSLPSMNVVGLAGEVAGWGVGEQGQIPVVYSRSLCQLLRKSE